MRPLALAHRYHLELATRARLLAFQGFARKIGLDLTLRPCQPPALGIA